MKPESVSTKQERIAKLAKTNPAMAFTSLNHYIDYEWVAYAYELTRKDGAVGVDGQTAEDYAQNLERNLQSLIDRLKSGRYQAPPVRRHFIPKGDGQGQRGLGIPSFEDKVAQRAIVMLLEPIYEQDFYDCSYGYRPGRSAHHALRALWEAIMVKRGRWVLDIDVCKYFDSIDHVKLRTVLAKRVTDGVVRRLLDKWLKAGVLEAGQVYYPEMGTPQGGVVSPLLSNIFLHYVLDEWFVETVQPRLKGRSTLVRFCDDFVMVFEYRDDVLRVQNVLSKRLERFDLQLHPDKSRLVDFGNHRPEMQGWSLSLPGTFNFLGFIHFWGKSRKGNWVVRQWMAKERLARALKSLRAQGWQMMHWPLRAQHARLCLQIRGYYAYFGITDNCRRLQRLRYLAERTWRRALARRTRDHCLTWETFARILRRFPLPRPRIVHGYTAL